LINIPFEPIPVDECPICFHLADGIKARCDPVLAGCISWNTSPSVNWEIGNCLLRVHLSEIERHG
jgi:hypothetical protein